MTTTMQANPEVQLRVAMQRSGLAVDVFPEGNSCVAHVSGELDLATRNQLFNASTAGNHPAMIIDLAGVTFMDCCGYGSLVASRSVVESGGRTLTTRGATGQPARLLEMIETLERAAG